MHFAVFKIGFWKFNLYLINIQKGRKLLIVGRILGSGVEIYIDHRINQQFWTYF